VRPLAATILATAALSCGSGATEPVEPRNGAAPSSAPALTASVSASPAPVASSSAGPSARELGLGVLPSDFDFGSNPGVVRRIAESPHHYYRFINPRFEAVVCKRFAESLAREPKVALHGDAHVEQYAATDLGRGLTDLDDTAVGPRAIDLYRMATSIVLAVHEKAPADAAFTSAEDRALAALFEGYARGVDTAGEDLSKAEPPPSALDARLEKRFAKSPKAFLDDAEKSMLPFADADEERRAIALANTYEERMLHFHMIAPKNKAFPAGTFGRKKMGPIASGIGSALDRRFLMRLEGRTDKPDDDLVVELKPLRRSPDPACLTPLRDYRAERFLVARPLAQKATRHFDPLVLESEGVWALEWDVNHVVVKIDKALEGPEDLVALASTSGFVLGREHTLSKVDGEAPPSPASSIRREDRVEAAKKEVTLDPATAKDVARESRRLASEVEAAWARFREAAGAP
jgi:hypothetical protein